VFSSSKTLTAGCAAFIIACSAGGDAQHSPVALDNDAAVPVASTNTPAAPRGSLVATSAWEILAAEQDPFADRLPDARCPAGAYMPELLANEEVFSVDTGACNYITARQPALRAVSPGERLQARVWHFALKAQAPAAGHVALRLGETVVLDREVPIPSAGGLIAIEAVTTQSFPEGTPVYFHLHNHGDNSWSLVELSAGPAL
jgi:hypothetical protein